MLGITFVNPSDYDKIQEDDKVDLIGLLDFKPGETLSIVLHHADRSREEFPVNHSYNQNQIDWFKAGSALNVIKKQNK